MYKTDDDDKRIEEIPLNKCPECQSEDLDHDGEERYCKKCGYVFD